jgi:hypothetical protein
MKFKIGDLVQPLSCNVPDDALHSMVMEVTHITRSGRYIHVYCHHCISPFYHHQDWLIFLSNNLQKL